MGRVKLTKEQRDLLRDLRGAAEEVGVALGEQERLRVRAEAADIPDRRIALAMGVQPSTYHSRYAR
jgi:hypothetical protein